MKRLLFIALGTVLLCSCTSTKLVNSATHKKIEFVQPVVAVFADLKVKEEKITYFMIPSRTVVDAGYDNVINTAVREALLTNDNADVLVGLETQVKYNAEGRIESVMVTGYPARYINFRSPSDQYLETSTTSVSSTSTTPFSSLSSKKK